MSVPIATMIPFSVVLPSAAVAPVGTTVATHAALPLSADLPEDVDLGDVITDLADDGVAAPAQDVADLAQIVDRAGNHGIELSIVVLEEDPGRDSQLRDLATEVGAEEGGTVLVLSPSWVGTYSDSISRVDLEAGQDRTYTGDPVVAADNFVDDLVEPSLPWALLTVVVVAVVAIASAVVYYVKARRTTRRDDGAGVADGDGQDTGPAGRSAP
ncbi:MAG: DUF6676 family protein [Rhodococcus sp. (in: high G+C Gram-positive bacteria)]|uniref:Rv1476 family membrane protein n=1 Tax=Rhodococcus sp. TaxID=1831 RepID=UPI003BAF772C